tara:strand:+ start:7115 stop:7666 length:552 start_codon:yes stop_codon:yes gene_type:complete
MLKKKMNYTISAIFAVLSLSYMYSYQSNSQFNLSGTSLSGTPAMLVIFLCLVTSIVSFLFANKKYEQLKKRGYQILKTQNHDETEAFYRDYRNFQIIFYNWRDLNMSGAYIIKGYRGLYMTLEPKGADTVEGLKLLNSLFDKVETDGRVITYYKEKTLLTEENLSKLIDQIHKLLPEALGEND